MSIELEKKIIRKKKRNESVSYEPEEPKKEVKAFQDNIIANIQGKKFIRGYSDKYVDDVEGLEDMTLIPIDSNKVWDNILQIKPTRNPLIEDYHNLKATKILLKCDGCVCLFKPYTEVIKTLINLQNS